MYVATSHWLGSPKIRPSKYHKHNKPHLCKFCCPKHTVHCRKFYFMSDLCVLFV